MNESQLIAKLQELQIEQQDIINQLLRNNESKQLKPGDQIVLLTSGRNCRKGDTAEVSKVTSKTVHFKVNRNGHITYKKLSNVRKAR